MERKILTQKIKSKALELGFAKVGITNAEDFSDYLEELESRFPTYNWLVKWSKSPQTGAKPRLFMPEAQSIVCTVYDYSKIKYPEKLTASVGRAYLSRTYLPVSASIAGMRVKGLHDYLEELGCRIDQSGTWLPERIACARAGIITYGKNNFAYADGCGSFIILNSFLIDKELEYDAPTIQIKCPSNCSACIDACPTGALYAPGKLNPQKCLLYSHMRGDSIPEDIRLANGTYIHGCDVCQEVCPRNKKVLKEAIIKDPFLEKLSNEFDLEKILFLDQEYYEQVIYPIMYNYIHIRDLHFFRRNAAIAIGNSHDPSYIPSLKKAMESSDPMVREASAWALNQIQNRHNNTKRG